MPSRSSGSPRTADRARDRDGVFDEPGTENGAHTARAPASRGRAGRWARSGSARCGSPRAGGRIGHRAPAGPAVARPALPGRRREPHRRWPAPPIGQLSRPFPTIRGRYRVGCAVMEPSTLKTRRTSRVSRRGKRMAAGRARRVEVRVPFQDAPPAKAIPHAPRSGSDGAELIAFFRASPFADAELTIERDPSPGRTADLA